MATYLPVLLVSVSAGMPDDAALQPLPRGQVDYLSHEWAEEDVWRSWRNMTKQKNEIANGARLENASWRTWWKQRNGLGTVSPETLNWLKDSDVTWLYGPLHTAVDWTPFPKQSPPPSVPIQSKDDAVALSSKSTGGNSMSSPSSSITLDRLRPSVSRFGAHSQDGSSVHSGTMKPILKHRSITEMLTSALPPTPIWAIGEGESESESDTQEDSRGFNNASSEHPILSYEGGRVTRPPLFHTKSDTNILPRFGHSAARKKARISPPRVATTMPDRDSQSSSNQGLLQASQRSGASNNLAEMAFHSGGNPFWTTGPSAPPLLESAESSGSTSVLTNDGASTKSDGENLSPTVPPVVPQRKHISFNAIVEQCIAIDGGSVPTSPFSGGQAWSEYDDGYVEDEEDGLFEDADVRGESDSDEDRIEEEEEILEIKPPSRRSSTSNLNEFRNSLEASSSSSQQSAAQERPNFRRQSNSYKSDRSHTSHSGSRSGSASGSTSQASRSRSSVAPVDREHVSIVPIAPTILKAGGGSDHSEEGILYMGGAPFNGQVQGGSGVYNSAYANNYGGNGVYGAGSNFAYGYGGYGYGEQVSAGRGSAFEHFERGNDAGELVYCGPDGAVYPWRERDAERFHIYTEYGMPNFASSPPRPAYLTRSQQQRDGYNLHSYGQPVAGFNIQSSSSSTDSNDAGDFEYYDRIDEQPEDDKQMDVSSSSDSLNNENSKRYQGPEDSGRLITYNSSEDIDNSEPRTPQSLDPPKASIMSVMRERTPSPEFQPKLNPRIASLKSESGLFPSSQQSTSPVEHPTPPTLAIPTPGISPAHAQEVMTMRSPPESPTMRSGLLSPPDMSPRGRSGCSSPVSGSATSSSGLLTSSRSVSESRSDSRGRSRTRNSSVSASSDAEHERGRSRSRSTASGANSPMESNSPLGRVSSVGIGGLGLGIGISGGFGSPHSNRDVRDGRGVKLYRKTSEDCIAGSGVESRGRNRSGKRVSESLSPPTVSSAPSGSMRRVAVSPPSFGSPHRSIPSSLGSQSYSANLGGQRSINTGIAEIDAEAKASFDCTSDEPSLGRYSTTSQTPVSINLRHDRVDSTPDRPDGSSDDGSCPESGSSTVTLGRGPSASSPDEERRNLFSTSVIKSKQPSLQPDTSSSCVISDSRKQMKNAHPAENKVSSPPSGPTPARAPDVKVEKTLATGSTSLPTSGKSQKMNELVSSARTLLGTIWNGSS